MIKETIGLLGHTAKDRLTDFTGVITSVSFDISGCVQAWITPPAKDGSEKRDGGWFDVQRLEVTANGNPVMAAPDFDATGKAPATWQNGPIEKADPARR